MIRIDVTCLPEWFANLYYVDSFNKAYYASILITHSHNNPILITFSNLLFAITQPVYSTQKYTQQQKLAISKAKIIRNRFWLWLFLAKNKGL
jgi:hypothetical protein